MDRFVDVVDTLRCANEQKYSDDYYLCTITSRKCYRTCEEFRENLYKALNLINGQVYGVLEYHSKAVKVHMHGYMSAIFKGEDCIQKGDDLIIDCHVDFKFVLHKTLHVAEKQGECKLWNKYCRKQIDYTYEYNDFVKKGLWHRFHKWGKRTKDVFRYELAEDTQADAPENLTD